ncbi:9022_t:CDS:2 [Funneliformis geosporum]|uniref:9022_t:CDS:1 n=1 Tax=Funneliformis geosporum TaxID=1117311 RepID=A0A9W4WIX7_9GLOM|nr:9022_t:CDS:2 [Funneliformis geosporum]
MSERTGMILFGLTGQGKSSIANMLIQGDVYREVTAFKVNEGTAGVTINSRVNDKFIVYDLIGIDEIVEGSVPHKKIIEKIRHGFVTRQTSSQNSDPTLTKANSRSCFQLSIGRFRALLISILSRFIKSNMSNSNMSERNRIVLFGLAGQGKSSIANMLIQGDIHHEVNGNEGNLNKFKINDGAVGASVEIICGVNNEFEVYDTIGVGETDAGSVPHKKAVVKIRDYFTRCEVQLNYIAYVKKQGRFTEEDRKMFNLFKKIFEGREFWRLSYYPGRFSLE